MRQDPWTLGALAQPTTAPLSPNASVTFTLPGPWLHTLKICKDAYIFCILRISNVYVDTFVYRRVKETFAPVVNFHITRVLSALAVTLDLEIHQMGVKTAFLNGELERGVYMEPTEGCQERYASKPERRGVLQPHKSLYGLKQAPRVWNKAFHSYIISLGFKRSGADYSLYIRKDAIIMAYIDDLQIFAKRIEVIRNIKQNLMAKYQMTDLGEIKRFLGVEINRDRAKKIMMSTAVSRQWGF